MSVEASVLSSGQTQSKLHSFDMETTSRPVYSYRVESETTRRGLRYAEAFLIIAATALFITAIAAVIVMIKAPVDPVTHQEIGVDKYFQIYIGCVIASTLASTTAMLCGSLSRARRLNQA